MDLPDLPDSPENSGDAVAIEDVPQQRGRSRSLGPLPGSTLPSPVQGRPRSQSFTALPSQQRYGRADVPQASVVSPRPLRQPMEVDHPDFLGYTGREHEFKMPVHAGPFKFSIVGSISPEVAQHYGLELPSEAEHRGPFAAGKEEEHARVEQPNFWGYTGREHEFKTPVRAGRFKFSIVGSISPEVARQYGLDQTGTEGRAPEQTQDAPAGQGSSAPTASRGKMRLGLGSPRVGGIFGEIVTAKLAKRAMKQAGDKPELVAKEAGDLANHKTETGDKARYKATGSADKQVEHKDFLGFTGREHEFKTPVRAGPFKFSVIGHVSPEVARHYGIDHLGFEGRTKTDSLAMGSARMNESQSAAGRGKMKLDFGPAKVGGVFGEIVTAKLAQRAMKPSSKNTPGKTASGKSGVSEGTQTGTKGKPVKFKLSVTPHIGGLLGDKVTAKLAIRARKQQAAKTTVAPTSSSKKSSC